MDEEYTGNQKGNDAAAAGWEVIYCSLALILVAFFAMLVSYSTVEGQKMNNFLRGFSVYSEKSMRDGVSSSRVMRKHMVSTGGNEAVSGGNVLRPSEVLIKNNQETVFMAMTSLKSLVEVGGSGNNVQVVKTENGFRATFGSKVLFQSGEASIKKDSYPYLNEMLQIALKAPFSMRVEGHTDDIPIETAEFPSNWELSTARAINVLRYFLSTGTISPKKIAAVGFGQYQPIASNDTPEGREKNRRVEFYFELDR